MREEFVREMASRYLERYPLDEEGLVHVQMMRLEVEAEKPRAGDRARLPLMAAGVMIR